MSCWLLLGRIYTMLLVSYDYVMFYYANTKEMIHDLVNLKGVL